MNTPEVNNLSEKKNQIQDLLQDIFNEYNRMNETKIQNNCEKDLEMRIMIETIRTLETSEKQGVDEIRSLKKTIHEYETLINNLNDKLETVEEDKQEENRFDMVRIQAKEITEKDREIDRLNGLINHYKNKNMKDDNQIDSVITKVECKSVSEITLQEVNEVTSEVANELVNEVANELVNEVVNEETGEVNPNFIYDNKQNLEQKPSNISKPNSVPEAHEPEPSPDGSIKSDIDLSSVEISEVETEQKMDKGKLIIVTSKKIKYYAYENEVPQTVYEFNGNKIADKPLGSRMKNEKGKYKVQLFAL
tara:strand:- start:1981 stop:2898 length:918 start_codon:yes stop_codon:yes gene_type:complete